MSEEEERAFIEGQQSVYRRQLREAISGLNMEGISADAWMIERTDAVAKLREIWRDFDLDHEWPDEGHLGDVLEKLADWLHDLPPARDEASESPAPADNH